MTEIKKMEDIITIALKENSECYKDRYTGQPRPYYNSQSIDIATTLYKTGYRKQIDIAKDIFSKIKAICRIDFVHSYNKGNLIISEEKLNELAEQYGVTEQPVKNEKPTDLSEVDSVFEHLSVKPTEKYPTYAEFIKTGYWHSADNDIKIIGYEKFDGYDVTETKLIAVKGDKVKILFNSEKGYKKAIKWLEDK